MGQAQGRKLVFQRADFALQIEQWISRDAQDRLFEHITALSAAGSRIAAETMGTHSEDRRQEMRERFARISEKMGVEQTLDIQDLIYNDPDRADVAVWLGDHGWRSAALNSQDEMRRLGRFVEVPNPDDDAFSTFVTAERI